MSIQSVSTAIGRSPPPNLRRQSDKVQQGLVMDYSHFFTEFEDSEDSLKLPFLHSCCCELGSRISTGAYVYVHRHRYTSIALLSADRHI